MGLTVILTMLVLVIYGYRNNALRVQKYTGEAIIKGLLMVQ
jgi:hypothetical protein